MNSLLWFLPAVLCVAAVVRVLYVRAYREGRAEARWMYRVGTWWPGQTKGPAFEVFTREHSFFDVFSWARTRGMQDCFLEMERVVFNRANNRAVTECQQQPAACRCVDCGGDQPEHDTHCAYMHNLHVPAPEQQAAEIEALRAEVVEWKRVASAQAELHGEAEDRAERLAEVAELRNLRADAIRACALANIPAERMAEVLERIGSANIPAERMAEVLERIAAWPDGGNQYGQANIKIFAAEALAAYRQGGGE